MLLPLLRALLCLFSLTVPILSALASMSLAGQFSVSDSGAAHYSIALQVPAGVAGMQPGLALNYNSQSGNGLPGVGWSLGGLSSIGRCPQSVAQDGQLAGVNYDAGDRFCLDGQRLIAIRGIDGANGTEYRTEQDSFSRVISYGAAGSGPAWFQVWSKSGMVMFYGSTASGRIEAQGKASVRVWALDRQQDARGNFFTVSYAKDAANGDFTPQRIDYDGNAVLFSTTTRRDSTTLYDAGAMIRNTVRLSGVQTYAAGVLQREYRLRHEEEVATGRSRLIEVAECDGVGNCLPPTAFGYSSNRAAMFGANLQSGTLDWGYGPGREWVDINRDGRADYCRLTGAAGATRLTCTTSTGSGFGASFTSPVLDPGYEAGRAWADVNGDGYADYCRVIGTGSGSGAVACTLFSSAGFGATLRSATLDWGYDAGRSWVDINADGRADFCRIIGAAGSRRLACTVSLGTAFGPTQMSNVLDTGYDSGSTWTDVNADGRPDYCRVQGDSARSGLVSCTFATLSGFGASITSPPLDWGYEAGRAWTDINGDGKADFCRVTGAPGSYQLTCTFSTGTGFGPTVAAAIADPGYDFGRAWVDVNGDGNADYCRIVGPQGATRLSCVLSTGAGFGQAITSDVLDPGYDAGRAWVDVNGDGSADYCRVIGSGGTSGALACTPIVFDLKNLTRITTGLGQQTSIDYKPLTDTTVHTPDSGAVYPLLDIQVAQYAVATVRSSNGIGGTLSTDYTYGGLKSDVRGRGLLGFRWVKAVQRDTGVATTNVLRQDWPYTGALAMVQKSIVANGRTQLLHQLDNTYGCTDFQSRSGCVVLPGRRYFLFVARSSEANWDLSGAALPTISTDTEYDSWDAPTQSWRDLNAIYGNPQRIVTSTSDGFRKITSNTYLNDPANWRIGQLLRSTVTSSTP